MALNPHNLPANTQPPSAPSAPLGGSRGERVQRIQIGIFGLAAMLLLVGLADIVISRAQISEASAVPEAAPSVVPTSTPAARDPLADAGVVPELPADTSVSAAPVEPMPAIGDVPPPASDE